MILYSSLCFAFVVISRLRRRLELKSDASRPTDLPAHVRQEDGSREKYQRFFDEMDKDGSKTIE